MYMKVCHYMLFYTVFNSKDLLFGIKAFLK